MAETATTENSGFIYNWIWCGCVSAFKKAWFKAHSILVNTKYFSPKHYAFIFFIVPVLIYNHKYVIDTCTGPKKKDESTQTNWPGEAETTNILKIYTYIVHVANIARISLRIKTQESCNVYLHNNKEMCHECILGKAGLTGYLNL